MIQTSRDAAYDCFEVERAGDTWIAHLHGGHHDEAWIHRLSGELSRVIQGEGCRKLVISFANIDALYSLFLAKLVAAERQMTAAGGRIILSDVPPNIQEVFKVCKLDDYLAFAPDRQTAIAQLG